MLKEIDKKATKKKSKSILHKYKFLLKIAGAQYQSKVTTTFSFEPKTKNNVLNNSLDKHLIRKMKAEESLKKIEEGINSVMNAEERQLLYLKYCSNQFENDIQIYMSLKLSPADFYRNLEKALLSFAECYQNGDLIILEDGGGVDDILNIF